MLKETNTMDAIHFDRIARLFADRRLSRRAALTQGGAGLAASALAAAGFAHTARAQDATPEVGTTGEAGEKTMFLFVQSFQSGNVAPKTGEDGKYTLTLEQGLGQTIYFSDRPERIVGTAPTPEFLAGLGFAEENPPNAALVVEPAPGETGIAVIELTNSAYDEATHTATYDVKVLQAWEESLEMGFFQVPADLTEFGESFGAAHLFIDDCSDWRHCWQGELTIPKLLGDLPGSPHGTCWSWDNWLCTPANCGDTTDYDAVCAQLHHTVVSNGGMVYAGI
jgi:hypothetical protein